jgi:hypothetical protein
MVATIQLFQKIRSMDHFFYIGRSTRPDLKWSGVLILDFEGASDGFAGNQSPCRAPWPCMLIIAFHFPVQKSMWYIIGMHGIGECHEFHDHIFNDNRSYFQKKRSRQRLIPRMGKSDERRVCARIPEKIKINNDVLIWQGKIDKRAIYPFDRHDALVLRKYKGTTIKANSKLSRISLGIPLTTIR